MKVDFPATPATQSSGNVMLVSVAVAARRQFSFFTGRLVVQHCAAMPVISVHSARPTELVTASSPGHRQKSALLLAELPDKIATPAFGIIVGGDSGIGLGDGGGAGGGRVGGLGSAGSGYGGEGNGGGSGGEDGGGGSGDGVDGGGIEGGGHAGDGGGVGVGGGKGRSVDGHAFPE
uniref:Uncharacterized protein n=1 Tax=Calcidiscus leptoporus TaxID=127549 RepID=A0A7S0NTD1_9EUKA